MRSRPTTTRRTPAPDAPRADEAPEPASARARPAARATAPAVRRAVRRPTEPTPEPPAPEMPLDPGELYRREKSRRAPRLDPAVMADARRQLEEMMTPISGRKRGSVVIGAAARRRKPAARPDEIELPEYRPGEGRGRSQREEPTEE